MATVELRRCDACKDCSVRRNVESYVVKLFVMRPEGEGEDPVEHEMLATEADLCPQAKERLQRFIQKGLSKPTGKGKNGDENAEK